MSTSVQKEKDVLGEIKRVRKIFDPGEKEMEQLILYNGPEKALAILQFAAGYYSSLKVTN